jgi:hypothetical protein
MQFARQQRVLLWQKKKEERERIKSLFFERYLSL